MRLVELTSETDKLAKMIALYGHFDLDMITGRPNEIWERRSLFNLRLPFSMRSIWFPEFWYRRIRVNRRCSDALLKVLLELQENFSLEEIKDTGLDEFVRCYDFGCGKPSLFWYGAGWELSPKVTGDALAQAIKCFVRHGWHYEGVDDKRRIREFEFW
jgi:hypothetical protein